jgi:glycosyltransferase involved in cell wall biosynthesis
LGFLRHLRILRQARLIYCNGSRQIPTLLVISLLVNSKVFYHIHTDYGYLEKGAIALAARCNTTAGIISNSAFIAKRLGTPSIVIENALDERFSTLPFKDRFSGQPSPFRAAVVGKVIPGKGQNIAARAVAGLPIVLHLIGETGAASQSFRASITGATFEGQTQDVPGTLDRLGIQFNLVPSVVQEAFGLAAIEGMAASCITIVSGQGGLSEVAARTGALIAADVDTLRTTLTQLIAMPDRERSRLSQKQYEATQKFYNPARFQEQIVSILAQALSDDCAELPRPLR